MRRYPAGTFNSSFSFGPGPLSSAIKALMGANVLVFLAMAFSRSIEEQLGLSPALFLTDLRLWQPATYMFLHAGVFHILFNMLALWMFGTELERIWGTRGFLKFYFVTGIGAGLLTVLFSLLPFDFARTVYGATVIGASGSIYGLLLAYALYFPDRPIYMYFVFAIPAKYFVMILGAIAFYSSLGTTGGVANATHLGGLIVGYIYLKGFVGGRIGVLSELKYRYLKWKINRVRKKFDVYSGGRANDWDRRVH
jgi:membrane associated rhomboid family serine protease